MSEFNKVIHLTHTDIISDNRILKECNFLAHEMDFHVLGLGISDKNIEYREKTTRLELISIKLTFKKKYIPRLVRHVLSYLEYLITSFKLLKRFRPNYIHCHDVIALSVGLILNLRFNKIRIIYDAHELESEKNLISKLTSITILALERVAIKSVDHLIVVNDSIAKWYGENLGFKKISVILNSPEVKKPIKFDPCYLRKKYNIEKNSKIYIYAGIFSENRGLRKISKIFSENHSLGTLIFIGYGPLKEHLSSFSRNYSNIFIHERVSNKKLLEILSSADVGICLIENKSLSLYYSLPNKLFEYTVSGIPIIGSSFPEIEKAISILNNGIVCNPEDEEDIIRSIKKIGLTKNHINYEALEEMSWENQMIKLRSIYKEGMETTAIAK